MVAFTAERADKGLGDISHVAAVTLAHPPQYTRLQLEWSSLSDALITQ
jgi:hypothetical protein